MSAFVLAALLRPVDRMLLNAGIQRVDTHLLASRRDPNQMLRDQKLCNQLVVPLIGSGPAHVECARGAEAVLLMFVIALCQGALVEASSSDT